MQQHDNIKEVALRFMWNGYNVSTGVVVPEPENYISMENSNDVCMGLYGGSSVMQVSCALCISFWMNPTCIGAGRLSLIYQSLKSAKGKCSQLDKITISGSFRRLDHPI